jgi:hypothetical protein
MSNSSPESSVDGHVPDFAERRRAVPDAPVAVGHVG